MNKILILEDHAALASMITDAFTVKGWQVTIAGNGRQGLEMAQKGGWDAIVTDLKMPQMDGMEFINAMQNSSAKSTNGPLIVYSNFAYGYAKDEALRRGATDFIAKDTMDISKLVDHVAQLALKHPPQAAAPSESPAPTTPTPVNNNPDSSSSLPNPTTDSSVQEPFSTTS